MRQESKFILLLLVITAGLVVQKTDQCVLCTELLYENDCKMKSGCKWETNSSCVKHSETVYNSFCETVLNPSNCSKTIGCAFVDNAFVDNKCTLFAGCTAYVKSSTSECYSISQKCISDGTTCIDAKECMKYNQTQCQNLPNNYNEDCIWDQDGCREHTCAEADVAYNTNELCNQFHKGCITTQAGCTTSPLQGCETFQGTEMTCLQMIGRNGKCEYNQVTGYCKARECEDASRSYSTNMECENFQTGCVTTGKGCINILKSCSSYNYTECQGYIGIEGICEGDVNLQQCRKRRCENLNGKTDQACNNYQEGCVTNGKECVSKKLFCSEYQGTFETCLGYIGLDGNCKGTSDKQTYCILKDCNEGTFTTDSLCQTIQSWCVTNGVSCVKKLSPCSSYSGNCDLIGSDGNCKKGKYGQCAAKICTDAPWTFSTNQECEDYSKGCVTAGAGCIDQTTCDKTISQVTCEGTNECVWSLFCIDGTSCSKFTTKSVCQNNQVNLTLCIWDNSQCREAQCTDFTGNDYQTDIQCESVLPGCVTNGFGCVDPNFCNAFQGTKETCIQFNAYCTNTSSGGACIARSCSDQGLIFTTDYDCNNYLPGCLTNGNGCIDNTAPCSSYVGSQSQCDQFYGYDNNIIQGTRCWSTQQGSCFPKQCYHGQYFTSDQQCDNFLKGCKYNGNDGCLSEQEPCSSYFGQSIQDCQDFKGLYSQQKCWWVQGQNCVEKKCSQNNSAITDQECNQFLKGCLTTGLGCIHESQSCESYLGDTQMCNNFTGNQIKCTRLESCQSKSCNDKIDAFSNEDCIAYHQNCRLQFGTRQCIYSQQFCTSYPLTSNESQFNKQVFCNSITLSDNQTHCAFDAGINTNCVERKCSLYNSVSLTNCENYLGMNTCQWSYQTSSCYPLSQCDQYIIPDQSYSVKEWFCFQMKDNLNRRCLYDYSNNKCKILINCEDITKEYQNGGFMCLFNIGYLNCQFSQNCYTTQNCPNYLIPSEYDENQRKILCLSLYQSYDGLVTKCKYDSGSCVASTCSDLEAKNQLDCDQSVRGCKYFQSKCYPILQCDNYTLPSEIQEQNRTFCQNMYSLGSNSFCSYTNGESTCSFPKSCDQYYDFPPGEEKSYCNVRRDATGIICMYDAYYPYCVRAYENEICLQVPITNDWFGNICDDRTLINYCTYNQVEQRCQIRLQNCSGYQFSGSADSIKIQECQKFIDRFGQHCTWKDQTFCETAPDNCSGWNVPIVKEGNLFCTQRIAKDGTKCAYDYGSLQCRNGLNCEFVPYTNSQLNCDSKSQGCTFYDSKCYLKRDTCKAYTIMVLNQKFKYCSGMQSSDNQYCTFLEGSNACTDKGTCESYQLNHISETNRKLSCSQVISKNEELCNYWTNNDCQSLECQNLLLQCHTLKGCSSYQTSGVDAIKICSGYQDYSTKEYCTADYDYDSYCKARTCDDVSFSTHEQCKQYMSTCKSDGVKCVNGSINCYNQTGIPDFCKWVLDSDNVSKCTAGTQGQSIAQCVERKCWQNVVATTNEQCTQFRKGCVTKGFGCISESEPCSSYYGNRQQCQNFIGNGIKCWGDSSVCRDRVCTDNITANTDYDCQSFLSDCVTNGKGCIDVSEPCTSYSGTKEKCKDFKGNNKQNYCWNNSNITTNCRNRECSDLPGHSDQECQSFLPSQTSIPNCISDGIRCVQYPQKCFNFKGTVDTCPKFTASDGPCKATNYSLNPSNCTPRVCSEAPKTYSTDEQCQFYHPSCYTTGRGCLHEGQLGCGNIETNQACQSRIECLWGGQCKSKAINCSSLTLYGQSACFNSGIKCAWGNNICRTYTCSDYINTTHESCNAIDSTCTTSGIACITIGNCSSYNIPLTCNSAQSLQKGRCFWDNSVCRQRKCQDLAEKTDKLCQEFLNGCKTSGQICISKPYDCSVFNKELCQQDSDGNACIYLNDSCQKYTSCQDILYSDYDACQAVSKLCVPSYQYCIAVRPCEQYENSLSCTKGVNDTKCGWLPSGSCQVFKSCEDLISNSSYECQNYNEKCVSDTKKCIEKLYCAQYTNRTLCYNIGRDGVCIWDDLNGACRKIKCEDRTIQDCKLECIIIDGQKCISKENCSNYKTKESCSIALDGSYCIYEQQACRNFECKDLRNQGNEFCIGPESFRKQCVYNGNYCELKQLCANYTSSISCNFGGTDGVCAYKDTCQLFEECEQADMNEKLCKSKVEACFWEKDTKKCLPLTCEKAAKGSVCNTVPSFDGNSFTVCSLINGVCQPVNPSILDSENCFKQSVQTFKWKPVVQKCVACKEKQTTQVSIVIDIIMYQLCLVVSFLMLVGV